MKITTVAIFLKFEKTLYKIEVKSNITAKNYELGPDNYELRDFLKSMDKEELKEHKLWEGVTWEDCSWKQSLKICNQVACYTEIPPKNIKIVKHITEPK